MIGTQIEVANRAHYYAIAPSACLREFVAHAPFDHDRHESPNRRVTPLFIRRPHSFLDTSAITRELSHQPFCDCVNL